jgi:uncharacterized protein (TIGR00369 family)
MPPATGIPADATEVSIRGFNKHVGPLYQWSGEGEAPRFGFAVEEKHLNSAGSVHGGMLMALADVSMSRTSRFVSEAPSCSTVALTCDFLAPGRAGDVIEARVRVTRRTRTMVFLSAEISAADRLLLTAQGVWKVGPAR